MNKVSPDEAPKGGQAEQVVMDGQGDAKGHDEL